MRRLLTATAAWDALVATALAPATAAHASGGGLSAINHIAVIYQENHSFDNLFGNWPAVNGQTVEGRSAAPAAQTTQVDQSGTALACLLQNDVNLDTTFGSHYSNATLTGALAPSCNSTGAANQYANAASSSTGNPFQVTSPYNSAFTNTPFNINSSIPASALTCAAPGRGAQAWRRGRLGRLPGRRLHGGHRAPLLPGASTNSTAASRTAIRWVATPSG